MKRYKIILMVVILLVAAGIPAIGAKLPTSTDSQKITLEIYHKMITAAMKKARELDSYYTDDNTWSVCVEIEPGALKVYFQVTAINWVQYNIRITIEEITSPEKNILLYHYIFLEDRSPRPNVQPNMKPDNISESWIKKRVLSDGSRSFIDLKSKPDSRQGEDRDDERWNKWLHYFKDYLLGSEKPLPEESLRL